MRTLLSVASVVVALVGAVVCVVVLWRRARRERMAAAGRAATARAAERKARLDAAGRPSVDPNPTGRMMPVTGDGEAFGLRWLKPDMGQPTQTLPPVSAPACETEPIPRVSADPDAPTLLAPRWVPTPADPDFWKHLQADPSDPTPECVGLREPVASPVADLTFTQILDRAKLIPLLSRAAAERNGLVLPPSENGAGR